MAYPIATLLLANACLVSLAHAGRPLATEDAGVLAPRACEWESTAARLTADGGDPLRAVSTQFGCGVGGDSQIALGYSRAVSAGLRVHALGVSGKTGLAAAGAGWADLALAWGLTATRLPGASLRHDGSALGLVASKALDAGLVLHSNLGWARSHSARLNSTTWNLAAERPLGAGVDLGVEVYGDDRDRPSWGLGARWSPSPRVSLNASVALRNDSARSRLVTLGAKLGF